jgi:hypothetical protein
VTRVSFIIPDLPGLGVWRLDSGGWNAAVELPGTLELLAQAAHEQRFIPAVLSLQNRTTKRDGQTRRFVVPVIELPDVTIGQLVSGTAPTYALNTPGAARSKPPLPAGPEPPVENGFENKSPWFGAPPALPAAAGSSGAGAGSAPETRGAASPGTTTNTEAGAPDDIPWPDAVPDDDEIARLSKILLGHFDTDEKRANITDLIAANRAAHADDLAAHVRWLTTQNARAEFAKAQA